MIDAKRCGRKPIRPNIRYYPHICLKGLKNTEIAPVLN